MALNSAFNWFIRKRMVHLDSVRTHPVEMQRSLFGRLIANGKMTQFGAEHGLKDVRNLKEFRRQVPIRTYDEIKPWIDRAREGEPGVLWPGETRWFAKSSGTSSDRSKFIPVTESALNACHYKGGKDLLALFCDQRPDAQLYDGKHLILGGSSALHPDGSGGLYG